MTKDLLKWIAAMEDEFGFKIGAIDQRYFDVQRTEGYVNFRMFDEPRPHVRLATNVFLMCVVMHYGFPTDCLDVTPSAEVAMWFALHKGIRGAGKTTTFSGVHIDATSKDIANAAVNRELPSLYIFLQKNHSESPVIDLREIEVLRGVAKRPFVQSAMALPFRVHKVRPPSDEDSGWCEFENPLSRWPTAVIKLRFDHSELDAHFPQLTQRELLPLDDPLYIALRKRRVPKLTLYSE